MMTFHLLGGMYSDYVVEQSYTQVKGSEQITLDRYPRECS